jgi:hypothetical protein
VTSVAVSKYERGRDEADAGFAARGEASAGTCIAGNPGMTFRLAITLALSVAAGGCVTTTAHQLVLTDNPLRDQAIACEKKCQALRAPAHPTCQEELGHTGCTVPGGSEEDYANCLDTCPGSRAKDGASCADPPLPGVICAETTRANKGAIAGGVGAGATIALTIAILSSPVILLTLFLLIY